MGGPAFYMRDALGQKWLGVIFSILIIFTYMVGYNMLAAYNLQSTFAAFSFYNNGTPYIIGIILCVLFGVIVLGGAKRLINVTEVLVPIMGVMYVIVAIIVLVINIPNLGHMFGMIFASAFDFEAIFGGFAGSCIMYGVKRGLYSNEAGMGSAPNAAARADVSHPAKQGLVQMLSVFIDTLLICTATAFMCLSTKVDAAAYNLPDGPNAAGYVQDSLASVFGGFGPAFIAIAMCFFAFTTLIGNYSYCEGCFEFIIGREGKKSELLVMRIIASLLIFVGSIASAGLVWDIADMMQGLMVVTNVPTIIILGGIAFKCLDDYKRQMAEGINPIFKSVSGTRSKPEPGVSLGTVLLAHYHFLPLFGNVSKEPSLLTHYNSSRAGLTVTTTRTRRNTVRGIVSFVSASRPRSSLSLFRDSHNASLSDWSLSVSSAPLLILSLMILLIRISSREPLPEHSLLRAKARNSFSRELFVSLIL